jgi:drug/metabolite transporter (DMT)-like permease
VKPPSGPRGRALAVLGLALLSAFCYVAIKAGLEYAPPLFFGGLRATIAGVALLALVVLRGRRPRVPRAHWPWLLLLAFTTTTLSFGGMFLSPGRVGAGIASVLGNLQPLVALVLAALLLGERVTRGKAVALVLGLTGVALITVPGLAEGFTASGVGSLLALGASTGAAVGSVVLKRIDPRLDLLSVTGWQFVIGALPLLLAAGTWERPTGTVGSPTFLALLLFLALGGTAFTTTVWFWLLRRDEVGRLSMLLFVVPVLGLALAALLYREPITRWEALGAGAIALGIVVLFREPPRGDRVLAGPRPHPGPSATAHAPSAGRVG